MSVIFKSLFLFFLVIILFFNCSGIKNYQSKQISGIFQSVKGVKDPLSCYCFNAGYLIDSDNKRIPVCFNDKIEINCQRLTLNGKFLLKESPKEATTPCHSGKMKVYMVSSSQCLD